MVSCTWPHQPLMQYRGFHTPCPTVSAFSPKTPLTYGLLPFTYLLPLMQMSCCTIFFLTWLWILLPKAYNASEAVLLEVYPRTLMATHLEACFSSLSHIIDGFSTLNPFIALLVHIWDWRFFTIPSPGFHKSSSSTNLKRIKFIRPLPLRSLIKPLNDIWVKITTYDFPLDMDPPSCHVF